MPQPAPMTRQELRAALDRQPRFPLAPLPTPLQEAPNLSRALGGPRILVKRDDLTGLGFGGNKVRHMEFVVGHVRDRGADVWVNINLPMRYPSLSNNARISGSAARKGGLRYVCVVPGGGNKHMDANRLLLDLMGAELHLIDTEETEEVHAYTNELADRLRAEGHTPFVQPFEPRVRPSGVMGYVNAAMEIEGQLDALGVREATIWMPAGGSHGGITLATRALGLPWQVTGVIYSDRATYFADVLGWTNTAAELLGLPLALEQKDLVAARGLRGGRLLGGDAPSGGGSAAHGGAGGHHPGALAHGQGPRRPGGPHPTGYGSRRRRPSSSCTPAACRSCSASPTR